MNSFLDLPRLREGYITNLRQGDITGLFGNVLQTVRDESGVDDYVRFGRHLGQGNFLSALKSLGTGLAETTTAAATLGGRSLLTAGAKRALPFIGNRTGGSLAKFLVPLNNQEQIAASIARTKRMPRFFTRELVTPGNVAFGGARPTLAGGMPKETASKFMNILPEKVLDSIKKNSGRPVAWPIATRKLPLFRRLPEGAQRVLNRRILPGGYGRGGILGSVARGAGQFAGLLPTNQVGFLPGRLGQIAPYLSMIGFKGGFSPIAIAQGDTLAMIVDGLLTGQLRPEELPSNIQRDLARVLQDSAESGKPLEYYENLRMQG